MAAGPETVAAFMKDRMLCVGCVITPFHTALDACKEHRVDETAFREDFAAAPRPRRERRDGGVPSP
jgi:hybrid cluster-associated redox disulfide protein